MLEQKFSTDQGIQLDRGLYVLMQACLTLKGDEGSGFLQS